MAMKLVLTFPPENDGELHFEVNRKMTGSSEHLEVRVEIAMEAGETALQTLRRLGELLSKQPAKLYYENTWVYN